MKEEMYEIKKNINNKFDELLNLLRRRNVINGEYLI